MAEQTFTFRTHGLPDDADEGQYVGFSEDGRAFILKWSHEFGVWGACGWEKERDGRPNMMPVVIALRDEMENFIVSHSRLQA